MLASMAAFIAGVGRVLRHQEEQHARALGGVEASVANLVAGDDAGAVDGLGLEGRAHHEQQWQQDAGKHGAMSPRSPLRTKQARDRLTPSGSGRSQMGQERSLADVGFRLVIAFKQGIAPRCTSARPTPSRRDFPCPVFSAKRPTTYLDSAFCEAHFKGMFPKAYAKLQQAPGLVRGLDNPTLANAVRNAILDAEALYKGGSLCYPDQTSDENKKAHGAANGFQTRNMRFTPTERRPSIALRKFFGVGTVCECHSLLIAVYYKALLDVLGDFLFDRAFAGMSIENGMSYEFGNNPIKEVLALFTVKDDLSNVEVGDWVYVVNRADYKDRHPAGAAGGWNLICTEVTPHKFVGFGLSEGSGASSLELPDILKMLKDYYDLPKTKQDLAMARRGAGEVDMAGLMRMTGGGQSHARLDTSKLGRRLSANLLKRLLRAASTNLVRTVA